MGGSCPDGMPQPLDFVKVNLHGVVRYSQKIWQGISFGGLPLQPPN